MVTVDEQHRTLDKNSSRLIHHVPDPSPLMNQGAAVASLDTVVRVRDVIDRCSVPLHMIDQQLEPAAVRESIHGDRTVGDNLLAPSR